MAENRFADASPLPGGQGAGRFRKRKEPRLSHPFKEKTGPSGAARDEGKATALRVSSLLITAKPEGARDFLSLLREGFLCQVDPGESVFQFLRERLGIEDLGEAASMGDITVNEIPADDGAFREENERELENEHPGLVYVRILDTGSVSRFSSILRRGILIESAAVDAFFAERRDSIHEMIEKAAVSGIEEEPGRLADSALSDICDLVHLVVRGSRPGETDRLPGGGRRNPC